MHKSFKKIFKVIKKESPNIKNDFFNKLNVNNSKIFYNKYIYDKDPINHYLKASGLFGAIIGTPIGIYQTYDEIFKEHDYSSSTAKYMDFVITSAINSGQNTIFFILTSPVSVPAFPIFAIMDYIDKNKKRKY